MLFLCLSHQTTILMDQDNGYAFLEVQEDGTKTICIDCWFEAQPFRGMSFDTRPEPDREAMWVHCEMHRSRMGHTTTNRGLAATAGLAGGSVATGTIIVAEVIDDCMSPQCTDSSEDETNPPATHGTRSPTSNLLTKDRFNYFSFDHFDSAIYWNDALHWLETKNRKLTHYILDIKDHEHPIITTIQIPQRGMNFLKSYIYMDPMLILMQIPYLLHLKGKLFESCGCLLLVCRDNIGSSEFTIYEMMKGSSVWSVRYCVDTDDFMTPLPEGWSIRSTVWHIVLGEREEDSLLVINLSGKVVQYNLISKALHDIFDCGSNQLDDNHDDDDDELPHQFEAEHNFYEFIPSFARV
ncbi:hypothetical protein Tco_0525174 [Tanacetum coccineum]